MSTLEQEVYLVEMQAFNPNTNATTTLRFASGLGFVTKTSETPADTLFAARVKQAVTIRRTMFSERATRGRSTVGLGDIVLGNDDGALDQYKDYGFDGRTLTVRRGALTAAYPGGFAADCVCTMQGWEFTEKEVLVKLRDRSAAVSIPLQNSKFAGSGLGTLEGSAELAGKPKPIVYGTVTNTAPPAVETSKLIFQAADKQLASVDAVYDRGVRIYAKRGTLLVAVGRDASGGAIWTSPDGITWTQRTATDFGADSVLRVVFANGIWIATGSNGRILMSEDGSTWTTVTSPFTTGDSLSALANGNGVWLIGAATTCKLARSTDNGVTWSLIGALPWTTVTGEPSDVSFQDGAFVIPLGSNNKIASSPDGLNWTIATVNGTWKSAAYGASLFAVCGQDTGLAAAIRTSPTLSQTTWTTRTTPDAASAVYFRIKFGDGIFVTVGNSLTLGTAEIATSPDGITWTSRAPAAGPSSLNSVAYSSDIDLWAAVGPSGVAGFVMTSPDGITWTNRTISSPTNLFDVGAGYGGAVETYASAADLLDNSKAPPAGTFKPYLSATGSYFRIGASPSGLVTADVTEGTTAADRTTAQVYKRLLTERALFSGSDYSSGDLTTLDAALSGVIGFYADAETLISAVLDQVVNCAGASWFPDRTGVFRIKQLLRPAGTPSVSFVSTDLLRPLLKLVSGDLGEGVPVYSTVVRHSRNWIVQDIDVATSVSDARKASLKKAWKEAVLTDSAVLAIHPLAPQYIEETLLTEATTATSETTRRQWLRGEARDMYEIVVAYNGTNAAIELADLVQLTHTRYGLNVAGDAAVGGLFRVIGIAPDMLTRRITLTLWGSSPANLIADDGTYLVADDGTYLVAA